MIKIKTLVSIFGIILLPLLAVAQSGGTFVIQKSVIAGGGGSGSGGTFTMNGTIGQSFAGTTSSALGNGMLEKGKVSGTNVKAIIKADVQGQPMEIQLDGKIEGAKMSGMLAVPGVGNMAFVAIKSK